MSRKTRPVWANPEPICRWYYTWRQLLALRYFREPDGTDRGFEQRIIDSGYCLDRYKEGL